MNPLLSKMTLLSFSLLLSAAGPLRAAGGAAASGAGPSAIPIVIDAAHSPAGDTIPLGCGFPLKEGQAKDVSQLAIEIPGQGMAPAQFEVRTRYDSGSILWLWTDFLAKPGSAARLVLNRSQPADSLPAILVKETPKDIVVNNGALELVWNKQYASPIRVSAVDAESRREITTGTGRDIYIIDQKDRRSVLGGNGGQLVWNVETMGKVRVVVRCEGYYASPDGTQVARAVVRYHIYRDRPEIRLQHSFIITRDNDDTWYKEIGIGLPLGKAKGAKAHFADRKGTIYSEPLAPSQTAWVFQKEYPVYTRKDYVCELGRDKVVKQQIEESAGWAALDNGTSGVMVAMKDFAIQFPKEFRASDGCLTIALWSGRDGRKLDYRPATLCKDWWREWVDFANKPKINTAKEFQPDFIRSAEFNPSCVGLSRNHELTFAYFAAPIDVSRCQAIARHVQTPPLAYVEPRWICHADSRAFWQMAAKGEGGKEFEDIEEAISVWFDEYMTPQDYFRYVGWYDWGKQPEFRYFKQTVNGVTHVYPVWYRIGGKNGYNVNKYLLLGWARSGDRKYLDAAERFINWTAQYAISRWDGGKQRRIKGMFLLSALSRFPYWTAPNGSLRCDGDNEFVTDQAMLYLLRDARWAKDSLEPIRDNLLKTFRCAPDFTGLAPDSFLSAMTGLYRIFPSRELREKAKLLFGAFTDPEGKAGMSEAWFSKNPGHYTSDYKLPRKSVAIMEYCDVFGYDERGVKILEKAALAGAEDSLPGVWDYCDIWGAALARSYQFSKNKDSLEKATHQLETSRALIRAYKKAPKKGGDFFVETLPVNPGHEGSWGRRYSFPELIQGSAGVEENKDRKDRAGNFDLGPHGSGVPFIALPTEIWMLTGYKEPDWN